MIPTFSWRLVAKLGAVIAVLLTLWWLQGRVRVSYQAEQERDQAIAEHRDYKAAVEASAAVMASKLVRDQLDDAEHASRLASLEIEAEGIRAAARWIPATEEKPDAQGVRRLAIRPAWWLCRSAQLARVPADIAACKASAGDAAVSDVVGR